jgi:hypothetical protein
MTRGLVKIPSTTSRAWRTRPDRGAARRRSNASAFGVFLLRQAGTDGARERASLVFRKTDALGNDDAAQLVAPVLEAGSVVSATYPLLAGQVSALAASAEKVRAADVDRRTTGSA